MTKIGGKRLAVLCRILAAFEGVEREDGVTLHEADVIDDYGSAAERKRARRLDKDRRWQEVPWADIERYHWILSFLDPKGFRYYLPAYMLWALYHYDSADADTASVDNTIYALSPSPGALWDWCMKRYRLFTPAQATAICCFLRFMVEEAGDWADDRAAWSALQQYWGKFCMEEEKA